MIFNNLSVSLIPYSNAKDMPVQSALQIYAYACSANRAYMHNSKCTSFSLCAYFTLSDLSCILQSKKVGAILKNTCKIQA